MKPLASLARVVAVLPQLAGGGLALYLLSIVLVHALAPVYLIPPAVDRVAAGAALVGIAAVLIAVRAGRTRLFLLGMLIAVFLVWGYLLTFEGGLILVVAAIVGAVVILSRVQEQRRRSLLAAGAGAVLAVSLSCLGLFALVGPAVDCAASGPVISTWSSFGFGSVSGSSGTTMSSKGPATGWLTSGGSTYVFSCAHQSLVDFHRVLPWLADPAGRQRAH